MSMRLTLLAGSVSATLLAVAFADESVIRKNLAARLPNLPHIDSVSPTAMKGLWEVRIGSELIYSDEQGSFVIEGELMDTQRHLNLTQKRIADLTAVEFGKLPLRDAVVWKQGSGAQRIVVFADPNCGYCKQLERDLRNVPDITVYTFLVPVLGGDSPDKSRAIWCARDSGKVWRNWMLEGTAPPAPAARCDSGVLDRNVALSRRHGMVGTPMLVFEDNERVPGIMAAADIRKKLSTLALARSKNKG